MVQNLIIVKIHIQIYYDFICDVTFMKCARYNVIK